MAIVQVKIDQAIRLFNVKSVNKSKTLVSFLRKHQVDFDSEYFHVDFNNLKERFFLATGFDLIIMNGNEDHADSVGKLSTVGFGMMIKEGKSPFCLKWDHDLFVHILGTINLNLDFKPLLTNLKNISNDEARAWAFEMVTLAGYVKFEKPERTLREIFKEMFEQIDRKLSSSTFAQKEFSEFYQKILEFLIEIETTSRKAA